MMKTRSKVSTMSLIFLAATAAWAVPKPYQRLAAINAGSSMDTKVSGWTPAASTNPWGTHASVISTSPSTQKTIGASVTRQAIMFKEAVTGNTMLFDGQITPNGPFAADFNSASYIYTGPNQSQDFKFVPEEIEIDPTTNDVFALVDGIGGKQIYRITKDPNGNEIATAMTFRLPTGAMAPNGNRAFVNPGFNGYKSGSIAIVPKTNGGHYLVFTTQSTVYQGICHWVYDIKQGAHKNELWGAEKSPGVTMNKCQKSATLTGFGTAVGGINTVYIGPPHDVPVTNGRFLMSRNNGPLYEVKGLFDSGPWQANVISEAPPSTVPSTDFAWVRNQWQAALPFP